MWAELLSWSPVVDTEQDQPLTLFKEGNFTQVPVIMVRDNCIDKTASPPLLTLKQCSSIYHDNLLQIKEVGRRGIFWVDTW